MPVVVSLLRGINVGGHHLIGMAALREVYESLGLADPRTYLQSGNVVFRAKERNLACLGARIEAAIEQAFGFHVAVVLRTAEELRDAIARNPVAARSGIDARRLAVTFLAAEPTAAIREKVLALRAEPEELWLDGREMFIYFPNGFSGAKLSMPAVERALAMPATSRNWNTVTKLLELAEQVREG